MSNGAWDAACIKCGGVVRSTLGRHDATRPFEQVSVMTRFAFASLVVPAVIVAFVVGAMTPVCRNDRWMDPVTGTVKRQTEWLGLWQSKAVITPSLLETRLVERGKAVEHDWQYTGGISTSVFGSNICFSCGRMPPIWQFNELNMAFFICGVSDEDFDAFIETMRSGDAAQQEAAVAAANATSYELRDAHPEWFKEESPIAALLKRTNN